MNRSRVVRSVAAAAASVALLAGCSGGVGAGNAASVGDRSVTRAAVDNAAEGVCLAIADRLEAQGMQLANAELRSTIVQMLSLRLVGDELAERYDVTPGADYAAARNQVAGLLDGVPEELHADVIDSETTQQYLETVATQAGRAALVADGTAEPADDEAYARGQELFGEVAADLDVRLDPRFGLVVADGALEIGNSLSSQPVSYPAQQGVIDPQAGSGQADPDWLMALPSSQRCG